MLTLAQSLMAVQLRPKPQKYFSQDIEIVDLLSMLSREEVRRHFDLQEYQNITKTYIEHLMRFTDFKKEYMDCFEKDEYRPEFLLDDPNILVGVKKHPVAL